MKKFLAFILVLVLLVASEYYFLTELFTHKRLPVLLGSFGVAVLCVLVFLRFFKNSVASSSAP